MHELCNHRNIKGVNSEYCWECNAYEPYIVIGSFHDIKVLNNTYNVLIETPFCCKCGTRLDVPCIERKNSMRLTQIAGKHDRYMKVKYNKMKKKESL